jgi:hypothetical protein
MIFPSRHSARRLLTALCFGAVASAQGMKDKQWDSLGGFFGVEHSLQGASLTRLDVQVHYPVLGNRALLGLPATTIAWYKTRDFFGMSLNPLVATIAFHMAFSGGDYGDGPARFNAMDYGDKGYWVHLIQALPNAELVVPLGTPRVFATADHKTDFLIENWGFGFHYEQRAGLGALLGRFEARAGVAMPWHRHPQEREGPYLFAALGLGYRP